MTQSHSAATPSPSTSSSHSAAPSGSTEAAMQPASPAVMYKAMETKPSPQPDTSPAVPNAFSLSGADGAQAPDSNHAPDSRGTSSIAEPAVSSQSPVPKQTSAADAAPGASQSKPPMPAGLDRCVHVFTRQAAAAAEASSRYLLFSIHT